MNSIVRFFRANPRGSALLAALIILLGYADLWRGGTEFAALFLVLGYVVLLPLAILAWGGSGERRVIAVEPAGEEPPYRAAAIVGAVVFVLYVLTLAPSTAMWDTSEYIAAAKILGIPHPPGNPLFVLIAHAFAMIPVPVSYAARVNLLAATTSAMAAALWFLVVFRCMRGWNMSRMPRIVAAAGAAWLGATAFSVWNQSVVNEKVYTVAMLGVAVVSWAALRWNDAPNDSRKMDALLVLIAYLCGLGYTNHPAGLLPLPAFALYVLLRRPGTILRWKLLLSAAVAMVIGLTVFTFQPIRAAHHPEINVGTPTACEGPPEFSCTFSGETWKRLMSNVSREQYGGHSYTDRKAPFGAQVGMWWLYFKWQWLRDAYNQNGAAQNFLAILFLGLGLLGGAVHWKRDKSSFAFVAPLIFTLTPALIFYLNFKYGWSQAIELGNSVDREVRDRDYFYLWSFATWAIWAGMGIAFLWQFAARAAVRSEDSAVIGNRAWAMASPVLLLALVPFVGNLQYAPRHGQTFTAAWARDLLQSVEPYGILVTNGDNDSFPVWYAQYVEGVRRDVSVVLVPYLRSEWYARELMLQRVAEYDRSGLAIYEEIANPRPTTPIVSLSPAEADQVPPAVQLDRPARFDHAGISATIPPRILFRDHLLILQMIKDNFPNRPIHFSIGSYPMEMGLGDYIVTQGLVQKLIAHPAAGNPAYVEVQGAYIDVERTRQLWESYEGKEALRNNRGWIDDASILIPTAYGLVAQSLARALLERGEGALADQTMEEAMSLARAARFGPFRDSIPRF